MDCYATVTLCDNKYTMDENGVVTINSPKTVYCTGFPTIPIVVLAQTTFPSFKRDKYTTQGGIVNPYTTNGRVDAIVGLSITTSGGSPMSVNATLQGGTISVTSRQGLMPKLAEWHIYGNEQQGRFVTRKPETEPCYYLGGVSPDFADKLFSRILGFKEYEIKDHLGNVRVAITDYKLPTNPDPTIQPRGVMPFAVDECAVNDYYPFGMLVKERSWTSENYRYGYNGKENDNEVKGTGNQVDLGARAFDPRVGRMFSPDPREAEYPWQTTYAYFANSPIAQLDFNGEGDYYSEKDGSFLGQDEEPDDNKVYTATGFKNERTKVNGKETNKKVFENAKKLPITKDEFDHAKEAIYAESSNNTTVLEIAAIYSVCENRAKDQNVSVNTTITPSYPYGVYGASKKNKTRYKSENNPKKQNIVNLGIIKALQTDKDFSNGAFFWDGTDFENGGGHIERWKPGYKFTNPIDDIFNQGNNRKPGKTKYGSWEYKYVSTTAINQTTFSKLSDEWRDAQYQDKVKPKKEKVQSNGLGNAPVKKK